MRRWKLAEQLANDGRLPRKRRDLQFKFTKLDLRTSTNIATPPPPEIPHNCTFGQKLSLAICSSFRSCDDAEL